MKHPAAEQPLDARLTDIDRQPADLTHCLPPSTQPSNAEDAQRAGRAAVICTVIETATLDPLG